MAAVAIGSATRKHYPEYEKWMKEFTKRYWDNGNGALWGVENYNEPWEGGGISGWARDCLQYREIQKAHLPRHKISRLQDQSSRRFIDHEHRGQAILQRWQGDGSIH